MMNMPPSSLRVRTTATLLYLSLPFVVMAEGLATETPAVIATNEIAALVSPHGVVFVKVKP